jgi:uncharacterized membrane protein YphA (DoxX/SURF4 family)
LGGVYCGLGVDFSGSHPFRKGCGKDGNSLCSGADRYKKWVASRHFGLAGKEKAFTMISAEKTNERALAFLRIAVGIFFVVLAEYKVFGTEFTLGGGFRSSVQSFLSQGEAYPFMRPLLEVLLAHGTMFAAFLVAYGEFAIGLSLIVGVLSRLASVFGFVLMIGIWFSSGYPGPHAAFWMYWGVSLSQTVFALCFLVLAFGRAEESWSLRYFLRAKVGK